MTATTLLRIILLAELALYALVARFLYGEGWSGATTALAIVAMALSGRGFIVCVLYAWAHIFRSPVPPEQRIGAFAFLRMVLTEYAAFCVVFSVLSPFERLFLGPERLRQDTGRLPVLLVHGYECNRGFWFWQRRRLERAGWCVATINLDPVFVSIDSHGALLHERIEAICAATGAPQVLLVGHSMGGLVARAYLRAHGTARVARLVTLGSPHYGSRLAALGNGPNARQMEPGNPWLAALNAPGAAPLPAQTLSARSAYDEYVMPQDSSVLPGARNVCVGPLGHLSMAFAPAVTVLLQNEFGAHHRRPL